MTKAFISYHHRKDQGYKNHLSWMAERYKCFEDGSVNTGDIDDDNRSSESIRTLIRDDYLRTTQVTILLCGEETRGRKHVDWELKSSMIDGQVNRKSGILVINLPGVSVDPGQATAALPGEQSVIYPDFSEWWTATTREQYEKLYPLMPARIVDQLVRDDVRLSIVPWSRVENNPRCLHWLLEQTAKVGRHNNYDLSRPMRRRNHNWNFG